MKGKRKFSLSSISRKLFVVVGVGGFYVYFFLYSSSCSSSGKSRLCVVVRKSRRIYELPRTFHGESSSAPTFALDCYCSLIDCGAVPL